MTRSGRSISALAIGMEEVFGSDRTNSTAAAGVTDDPYSAPPDLEPSDYIEIGLLICMVIVGGPLNLVALFRLLRANVRDVFRCCLQTLTVPCMYGRRSSQRSPNNRQGPLTLRFHLTVANLLVLWVYSVSEICWLCTYSWLGGDLLCRTVRFVHAFCFYATSNLVAAIGIDRLHVTVYVDRPKMRSPLGRITTRNNVRWLASIAWGAAFLSSLPQLFVWGTFEPFPQWAQCVTIWTIAKYQQLTANNETSDAQVHLYYQEKLYDGLHLALVFWIPAVFITVSYASIVTRFSWNIRKTSKQSTNAFEAEARRRDTFAESGTCDTLVTTSTISKPSLIAKKASLKSDASELLPVTPSRLSPLPLLGQRSRSSCASTATLWRKSPLTLARRRHTDSETRTVTIAVDQDNGKPEEEPHSLYEYSTMLKSAEASPVRPQRSSAHRVSGGGSFAIVTLTRAKRRTVRKTVWILLAYFIFWSPYNVLALYRYFHPAFEHPYLEIMYNLIVLNAVVNPLIYGM